MLYPLHALNLNMLQVQGRSDLFLILEIIKKALLIPTIIIGIIFGIKIMIIGMIVNSLIAYYLNSYWSGKMINYPMKEQIFDILPSFFIAIVIGIIVFVIGMVLPLNNLIILIVQILSGAIITILILEVTRLQEYREIKEIVVQNIAKMKLRNITAK
jgi:O-antigen/teichoic acid export membrane protein